MAEQNRLIYMPIKTPELFRVCGMFCFLESELFQIMVTQFLVRA
jgi:hypothetical protein